MKLLNQFGAQSYQKRENFQIDDKCFMTLLEKIIKMYIRIRSFSHIKDLWKKHLNKKSLEKRQKAL